MQIQNNNQVNNTQVVKQKQQGHKIDIQNNNNIKQFLLSYSRTQIVKGIKINVAQTNHYHKQLKKTKTILDIPNLDKIIDCPPNLKIILVEKDFKIQDIEVFKNQNNQQVEGNLQLVNQQITITYKNLSTQQLFDLFTSAAKRIPYPNSFQTIGHLAHYNLTAQQISFHKVIGQITLLKCPNITCVVNKTQKLHNIYRTPTLQMMAGTQDYMVKLKEVGTRFQFDFQKVYWCSRLQQERDRLLAKMKKSQCLADIFCGCGPLAVRAARKGLYVIANDLNPYGYQYLVHNSKINKVEDNMICYNMCARQVVRKLFKQKQTYPLQFQNPDHIYMNLPVDAIQFLDNMKTEKLPLIHVNCFVVADTEEKSRQLLATRIAKTLPGFKEQDILQMNHIKNVTIIMRMYCVTFKLKGKYQKIEEEKDKQIVLNDKGQENDDEKQDDFGKKKIKTD